MKIADLIINFIFKKEISKYINKINQTRFPGGSKTRTSLYSMHNSQLKICVLNAAEI